MRLSISMLVRFQLPLALSVLSLLSVRVHAGEGSLSLDSLLDSKSARGGSVDRVAQLEESNQLLLARIEEIEALLREEREKGADDERIAQLEAENEELKRRIDAVAAEFERISFGNIAPPVGDSIYGLGPAASKIYGQESGLSIGGYGEMVYENRAGSANDEFDFLRSILYFGYKFNDKWIFNSEIEWEHADTGSGGSVSVEFAYLDYLHMAELNFRAGILLVPMGFINELHEPVTFLSANRPLTERFIMPSTWRENGVGIFGDVGDVSYRTYVINGLDAAGFTAGGLRGGRQKGSQTMAEDLAWVGRVDWNPSPGLTFGASSYYGDSGQGQTVPAGPGVPGGPLGDTTTQIYEAHAEYKARGFHFRALGAIAELDDVSELNAALGLAGNASVGDELQGYYGEIGFDILTVLAKESSQELTPFVRYEAIDTQASVPQGFMSNPLRDEELITFGLNYKPISQIVFKLDFNDFDQGTDQWNAALGYVF